MKKGEKMDMGNGFVFHITSENQSGKSLIGFITYKNENEPIGQTSITKEFLSKWKQLSK